MLMRLKSAEYVANSADPDQMPSRSVATDLDLY